MPEAVIDLQTISPNGQWVVVRTAIKGESESRATVAHAVNGGSSKRICAGLCGLKWSPDGKFLELALLKMDGAKEDDWTTYILPFSFRSRKAIFDVSNLGHQDGRGTVEAWRSEIDRGRRVARPPSLATRVQSNQFAA